MTSWQLVQRGLVHYWRTNLAVVGGVATAVAVLAGALLVGDSVRGSLRALVLQRLGAATHATVSPHYFRASLADDLRARPDVPAGRLRAVPLIAVPGVVTEQESSRRAGDVRLYGVDARFWAFHDRPEVAGPSGGEAWVSRALAREIGAVEGSAILVRVQRPSDVPLESLHGRKDDVGRTTRVVVRRVLPASELGEFSLEPGQGEVRAVFVSLPSLQRTLDVEGRANTLLFAVGPDMAPRLQPMMQAVAQLTDLQISVRALAGPRVVSIGSDGGLIDDAAAVALTESLGRAGMSSQPVLTYLANTLRVGDRRVPYSLVAALDLDMVAPLLPPRGPETAHATQPVVLNAWAAGELKAAVGDQLTLDYFVWEEPGRLATRSAEFQLAAVVATEAGDRDLAPTFPGISDSPTLADWDPPFPIDLRRVRPADEAYWTAYRTTPKAFVPLTAGQGLWRSRYGQLTSIRVPFTPDETADAARERVLAALRPATAQLALALTPRAVRAEALAASRGATDFGEYFVYFSFFIVVSALLLAALFFKLGVEQRGREVGLLRAVGFGSGAVRRLFLAEGLVLATVGSGLGLLGAVGYAALLMLGLRSWWVAAVGTTALTLHIRTLSLLGGAAGGLIAAAGCIWWTLRGLSRLSERSLLAGETTTDAPVAIRSRLRLLVAGAAVMVAGGLGLIGATLAGLLDGTGAFFGAGAALLVASLLAFAALIRRAPGAPLAGHGWTAVSRLGIRSSSFRPGRAVLSVAVMASATFILISVDAFRRDGAVDVRDRRSGTGAYPLMIETLLPIVHDPNTQQGRDTLNLFDLDPAVTFEPLRLLPGDDASCLNLYEPRSPRILAPRDSFRAQGRFAFQRSLAATDPERQNPWRLLDRVEPDGAVPVIADANSMTYVLHRALGQDLVVARDGRDIRLRFVAALSDSIFQRELLMSESNFLRLFPQNEGYRVMLVDAPAERAASLEATIESTLTDYGADVVRTGDRLAEFHKVENTYLSTFQALGGLGLLLGTFGLGTVLLRNVLERRKELALLAAVGFERRHFALMVLAENVMLLAAGLLGGAFCASLAIAPALADRGVRVPLSGTGVLLLAGVLGVGVSASLLAVLAATRTRLVDALRSE